MLGKFFAVCVDKGWLAASPATRLPKPVREAKRERVLTAVELGEAWNALQDAQSDGSMPGVYARVLSALALTGCRASEITGLQRGSVDIEAATDHREGQDSGVASCAAVVSRGARASGRGLRGRERRRRAAVPDASST